MELQTLDYKKSPEWDALLKSIRETSEQIKETNLQIMKMREDTDRQIMKMRKEGERKRRKDEKRRLAMDERRKKEEEQRRKEEEQRRKEEEQRRKEEEQRRKEEEQRRKEEEERRRKEEEQRRKEEEQRRKEEEERRKKEEEQRRKEEEQRRKEEEQRKQERDREMAKLKQDLRDLAYRFTSQSGHIIEGLMEPSAMRIFQKAGYDVDRCTKNYKIHIKATGKKAEYDVILLDNTVVIVVEVKINCTKTDVDDFIKHMIPFRELFPEAANKEVLGAMAAINYDRNSDQYAHEQGLFVVRVDNDEIFSLDDSSKDELRKF